MKKNALSFLFFLLIIAAKKIVLVQTPVSMDSSAFLLVVITRNIMVKSLSFITGGRMYEGFCKTPELNSELEAKLKLKNGFTQIFFYEQIT